jgi:hypothetical protein
MRFWIIGAPPWQWCSRRFVRAAGVAEQSRAATIEPQTDAVERVFRASDWTLNSARGYGSAYGAAKQEGPT